MKYFILMIIGMVSSCSTVSDTAFLNQVKGKSAFATNQFQDKRGSFSSDGTQFNFLEETVPFKIERATSDNEAEYTASRAGASTRIYFTIKNTQLTVREENGQDPYNLYLK